MDIKIIIKQKMNPIKLSKKNILMEEMYFKSINHFIFVSTYDLKQINIKYITNPIGKSNVLTTYIILNFINRR